MNGGVEIIQTEFVCFIAVFVHKGFGVFARLQSGCWPMLRSAKELEDLLPVWYNLLALGGRPQLPSTGRVTWLPWNPMQEREQGGSRIAPVS